MALSESLVLRFSVYFIYLICVRVYVQLCVSDSRTVYEYSGAAPNDVFNLLNPSGNFTYHQV
jgi:hypothetical protein